MTPFEKLAIKIKKDLWVDLYNFQSKESTMDYGSCSTVKDLLKGKELDI